MQFTQIIFDLDGTISDPDEGIKNSLDHALRRMGIPEDVATILPGFIGPPLHEGFQNALGMSEQETEQAVFFFREYYGTKGLFENSIYPGIKELLEELKILGFELHLATSKLEKFAIEVLEFHGILTFFSVISGAAYKGKAAGKRHLIDRVLEKKGKVTRDKFLMIGDTRFDILGAKSAGIKSLGVLYGYGSEKELTDAGADYLAGTVGELRKFLTKT